MFTVFFNHFLRRKSTNSVDSKKGVPLYRLTISSRELDTHEERVIFLQNILAFSSVFWHNKQTGRIKLCTKSLKSWDST
jgi:hypothetical protein